MTDQFDVKVLEIATKFHTRYEQLAEKHGYMTREDTRQFKADSPNGKLMLEVCGEMYHAIREELLRGKVLVDFAEYEAFHWKCFAAAQTEGEGK